jgi:hypothetical protein
MELRRRASTRSANASPSDSPRHHHQRDYFRDGLEHDTPTPRAHKRGGRSKLKDLLAGSVRPRSRDGALARPRPRAEPASTASPSSRRDDSIPNYLINSNDPLSHRSPRNGGRSARASAPRSRCSAASSSSCASATSRSSRSSSSCRCRW